MWISDNGRNNDYSNYEAVVREMSASYSKTVSVVIPFYRGLELLERSLAGLLRQTYPRELMEIIVSEDGNAGEADTLVSDIAKQLNARLVQHPRDGYRLSTARNDGIIASSHEVIMLLDFDMIPVPELVEAHLRWFHAGSDLATIGLRRFVDAAGIEPSYVADGKLDPLSLVDFPSASNRYNKYDNRLEQFAIMKSNPYPFNCFHGCNVAFRRDHALQVGLFDEVFNGSCGYEDIEFGLRLWTQGVYLVYEPNAIGLHQENSVVTYEEREDGRSRNLKLLYDRAPLGYRRFRQAIGKDC